jgi:hypothetical protein
MLMIVCTAIRFSIWFFGYLNFQGGVHLIGCSLRCRGSRLESTVFRVIALSGSLPFSLEAAISVAGHRVVLVAILVVAFLGSTIWLLGPVFLCIVATKSAIIML